jgi:hypothetical protein
MSQGFQVDLSALPAAVVEEFRLGRLAREVHTLRQAPKVQAQIAKENAGEHRAMNGLGRLRMVVGPDAFHYWGRRLGYECWRDKAFLNEFERDNPAVRVKCGGTKIQVGYRPSLALQVKFPERVDTGLESPVNRQAGKPALQAAADTKLIIA